MIMDNLAKKRLMSILKTQKESKPQNIPMFSKKKPCINIEDYINNEKKDDSDNSSQNDEKNGNINSEEKINCFRCKYFYITWNIEYPKGCSKFCFESDSMPTDFLEKCNIPICPFYKDKFAKTDPNLFLDILKKFE